MSEKDTIFKGKIKSTGIFDFKDFYSFSYDWLRGEGYDVFERRYAEKVAGDTKQIEVVWEADREISDYFKFRIVMEWMITGMKSVEVQKEGQKIKMDSGGVEIKFRAVLIKDYEDRWENNPFWKFLRGIYEKYIIRSRIEEYQIKLLEELGELVSQCKAFLSMEGQQS